VLNLEHVRQNHTHTYNFRILYKFCDLSARAHRAGASNRTTTVRVLTAFNAEPGAAIRSGAFT